MKQLQFILTSVVIGILASQLPTGNVWILVAELILAIKWCIDAIKFYK